MDEHGARALLDELAGEPPPPTTVDVTAAVSAGRRRFRARRWAITGGATLTVCALLTGVGVLASAHPDRGDAVAPPAAAPATSAPAVRRTPPATAPASFDPLVPYADFGWLPDGLTDRSLMLMPDHLSVMAGEPGTALQSDRDDRVVWLRAGPRGAALDLRMPYEHGERNRLVESPAPPVNGRPAFWIIRADGQQAPGQAGLRWQYAPGAWADVAVSGFGAADHRDLAQRIAADVTLGLTAPLRLPFHLDRPPAGMPVQDVGLVRSVRGGRPFWNVNATFAAAPGSRQTVRLDLFSSTDRSGDGGKVPHPTTTINGHPATVSTDGGEQLLQVFDVDGWLVRLMTDSVQPLDLGPDGLVGVYRGIRVYPTDPATWTDRPLG